MGSRRQAREMALQMLCTMERQPELSADQAATLFFKYQAYSNQEDEGEASATPQAAVPTLNEDRIFSEQLVRGVSNYQSEIDGLLSRCSRNWRLERMSWVDRNLLRLASFELLRCPQTPPRVAINEAIELAKRFGTAESSAFVNGVLDRMLAELTRAAAVSAQSKVDTHHQPA